MGLVRSGLRFWGAQPEKPWVGLPKVALLFLTRGPLPHEPVWRRFLEDIPDTGEPRLPPSLPPSLRPPSPSLPPSVPPTRMLLNTPIPLSVRPTRAVEVVTVCIDMFITRTGACCGAVEERPFNQHVLLIRHSSTLSIVMMPVTCATWMPVTWATWLQTHQ